jgi:diadenylate cyclase
MFKVWLQIGIVILLVLVLVRVFRHSRGIFAFGALVLFLTVSLALADFFELNLISRLLTTSSTVLLLAFVVIFQPEMRHMLAGVAAALHLSQSKQQVVLIEKIVQGLEYLRERQYGALIAFEQGMGNMAVRESGVNLNAEVSEELIGSVFTNKTPLHDGGMLIHGDRILAAGCIFPVTERQDLDRLLGLRHRAALGYSESTDSVVAVLSEETGLYSIAYRGELERALNVDQLRIRLTDLFGLKKEPGKKTGEERENDGSPQESAAPRESLSA